MRTDITLAVRQSDPKPNANRSKIPSPLLTSRSPLAGGRRHCPVPHVLPDRHHSRGQDGLCSSSRPHRLQPDVASEAAEYYAQQAPRLSPPSSSSPASLPPSSPAPLPSPASLHHSSPAPLPPPYHYCHPRLQPQAVACCPRLQSQALASPTSGRPYSATSEHSPWLHTAQLVLPVHRMHLLLMTAGGCSLVPECALHVRPAEDDGGQRHCSFFLCSFFLFSPLPHSGPCRCHLIRDDTGWDEVPLPESETLVWTITSVHMCNRMRRQCALAS